MKLSVSFLRRHYFVNSIFYVVSLEKLDGSAIVVIMQKKNVFNSFLVLL